MTDTDPHIHVEQKVLEAGPDTRNLISSALGRAIDAPTVVITGCGQQVRYAMTSSRPESVTCLACREYAYEAYLRAADQIARFSGGPMPGVDVTSDQVAGAVERLRELARRYEV